MTNPIFGNDNEYQNVRSFLLKYINIIVQENIIVKQGGNPNYDNLNLSNQRIIFNFEIINNLDKSSTDINLTRKSMVA
ncbi:spiroplasma phage ORF1-like family protein [Spiroplasma endosymbiont of Polydrusus formosus]|uniref:spiroplasma phage ORF1-like family protein n=1 Tax=Spiroplasma endosymbiont of Polydrusus formosus TaxID=3139326 RepID=UPI0035B54D05